MTTPFLTFRLKSLYLLAVLIFLKKKLIPNPLWQIISERLAIVPEPAFSRNYPNQTTLGRLQEVGLHPQGG